MQKKERDTHKLQEEIDTLSRAIKASKQRVDMLHSHIDKIDTEVCVCVCVCTCEWSLGWEIFFSSIFLHLAGFEGCVCVCVCVCVNV